MLVISRTLTFALHPNYLESITPGNVAFSFPKKAHLFLPIRNTNTDIASTFMQLPKGFSSLKITFFFKGSLLHTYQGAEQQHIGRDSSHIPSLTQIQLTKVSKILNWQKEGKDLNTELPLKLLNLLTYFHSVLRDSRHTHSPCITNWRPTDSSLSQLNMACPVGKDDLGNICHIPAEK